MTVNARVRLRPADTAWLILWTWVFLYNCFSAIRRHRGDDRYELLSEACQRYLTRQRWPTELWLLAFYLHLARHVSPRWDPVCWLDTLIHWLLRVSTNRGEIG